MDPLLPQYFVLGDMFQLSHWNHAAVQTTGVRKNFGTVRGNVGSLGSLHILAECNEANLRSIVVANGSHGNVSRRVPRNHSVDLNLRDDHLSSVSLAGS